MVRRAQIGGRLQREEKVEAVKRREYKREIYKAKVNQSRNMLPLILACYTRL